MATPKELENTFSFIAPFLANADLQEHKHNALPLYAVGLYLGIEDMKSFATDALTDHPQDKKADIIHIDEASGTACIAQGTVSANWGAHEAKANKAGDLNTAVAWLLQSDIDKVPDVIRTQASLLRDGLEKKTIKRFVVLFAHNALESTNVEQEVEATKSLIKGLPACADVEVDVEQLGLHKIEALYLAASGAIQVNEEVILSEGQDVSNQSGTGWNAYVFSMSGSRLRTLYKEHSNQLFSANLRDFLGWRQSARNVNNKIKASAEEKPDLFYVLNNGITCVTKKVDYDTTTKKLTVHGISIVNGAQTTGAIYEAGEKADAVQVLTRVITVDDPKLITAIVTGNNTQNSIVAWDRRSNDPVQMRVASEFEARGISYVHRRDDAQKPADSLFAEQVGQLLCAFGGDLQTAIRAKAEIFELDKTYNQVFPNTLKVNHVFAVQALGWAYDVVKSALKQKKAQNQATDLEQTQFALLDFPASKQFIMYVIGRLREEVAGKKLAQATDFELSDEAVQPHGQAAKEAWRQALVGILPTLATGLPASPYEVVRSTEHAEAVVTRAKAIVAGAAALQENFIEIRKLLLHAKA